MVGFSNSYIQGGFDKYKIIFFVFFYLVNNYIVRSYGDVIVVTNIATRGTNKAQSIVMY